MKVIHYTAANVTQLIRRVLRTIDMETVDLMQDEVACQYPSPGEFRRTDLSERVKALRDTLCWDVGSAKDPEAARAYLFDFAAALEEHLDSLKETP